MTGEFDGRIIPISSDTPVPAAQAFNRAVASCDAATRRAGRAEISEWLRINASGFVEAAVRADMQLLADTARLTRGKAGVCDLTRAGYDRAIAERLGREIIARTRPWDGAARKGNRR